jgi:hypothetical protein
MKEGSKQTLLLRMALTKVLLLSEEAVRLFGLPVVLEGDTVGKLQVKERRITRAKENRRERSRAGKWIPSWQTQFRGGTERTSGLR